MSVRRWWISDKESLPVAKQCVLASVNRSTVYLPSIVLFPDAGELLLLELIDKEYTRHPFYGSRKIMHYLRNEGYKINRKRVQRLMRMLGLPVWRRAPIPASRIRSTRSTPIFCGELMSQNPTKSGRLILVCRRKRYER